MLSLGSSRAKVATVAGVTPCDRRMVCTNTGRGGTRERFTPTRVGTACRGTGKARCEVVHPHSRGDSVSHVQRGGVAWGSPPLAWGQRRDGCRLPDRCGFTPTRVGTAFAGDRRWGRSPGHPHSRGDSVPAVMRTRAASGSPPLAWGQRELLSLTNLKDRFTPTRVGTAPAAASDSQTIRVHPHSRGGT